MTDEIQTAEAGLQERTVITPKGEILTIVYAAKGDMLTAVYAKAAADKTMARVTGTAWTASLALAVASPTTFEAESKYIEQKGVDRLVAQGVDKRKARNAGGVLRRPRAILKAAIEAGIAFDATTGRNALERAVKAAKAEAATPEAATPEADTGTAFPGTQSDTDTLRDLLARKGEGWIMDTLAEFAASEPQQATA